MTIDPELEYVSDLKDTIELAAEDVAKKVPKTVKDKTYKLTIYAVLSGEHNPIHGYRVGLGGGG
jgi:hypothetical protein